MSVFIDLVDFASRSGGGVPRYKSNLIQELVAEGVDTVVYTRRPDLRGSIQSGLRCVQRHNFRGRSRFPIDNILVSLAFMRSQCDLMHSAYYSCPIVSAKPVIVTAYDMIHERFPGHFCKPQDERFRTLKRRALSRATHIIAISESVKADVIEICGVLPAKISVVYLGVEGSFERPKDAKVIRDFRHRFQLDEPYLLFLGSRGGYKNYEMLLKAFFLSGLAREYVLIAFGSSPEWRSEEVEICRTLGGDTRNRVRLGGHLTQNDLVLAYSAAACLVYPSLYEGFGLPVLEAMACGTPVICSKSASLPEVGGEVAIYCEGDQMDSLVVALRSFAAESHEGRTQAGLRRAKTFAWRRTAQLTRGVYEMFARV